MKLYRHKDFATLYQMSLIELMQDPEFETKPRDLKIKENTHVTLILENPASCLYDNQQRSSQRRYIAAELVWYFLGRNDVDFIRNYAKFWDSIQNPDGTVNSSYGNLLFTEKNEHGFSQYNWAFFSLAKDRDSRQAIMHFNQPKHQWIKNKDFVCTMYGIFQIRNNKLNLSISMRSNDVVWGLPTDIAFFATLQSQMLSHLQTVYPDLEMGTYTHKVDSFHIYEHHFDIANRMLEHDFLPDSLPQVKSDLIDQTGNPSLDFRDTFDKKIVPFNKIFDPLYSWISLNMR
jgi:thymidylate synthase